MSTTAIVYLCGLHSVGLAIFHAFFWKFFNWRTDLKTSSISTRAIIQISNLRLIYIFLMTALICFLFPAELAQTNLGKVFMAGMSLFWVGRTVEQFIFLPYNRPAIHALTAAFIVGAVLFAIPIFRR